MKYIDAILTSWKTVFSYQDIELLLWISNRDTMKSFFARWVKLGIFRNVYKGIYVIKKYDSLELASKLKNNSYISFETVLKKEGIIFQDYGEMIFVASDQTVMKQVEGKDIRYLKLKNSVLTNPLWVISKGWYMIASTERAICDRLYLSPWYYFDNLEHIDMQKLEEISQIYNKRVILEVKKLLQHA